MVLCRLSRVLLAPILLATAPNLTAQSTPTPDGWPPIQGARARADLFRLADDSMGGREPGSLGNFLATEYIASEFRRLGLQPAGDSGTYFQRVPFVIERLSDQTYFRTGDVLLALGEEFLPAIWLPNRPLSLDGVEAVYGGDATDPSRWISPEAAEGKVVVLTVGPDASGQRRYMSTRIVGTASHWQGAAAVVLVELDLLPLGVRRATIDGRLTVRRPQAAADLPPLVLLSPHDAQALFPAPLDQLPPGATGRLVYATAAMVGDPTPYAARNVVAILPGSDLRLRHQYVALTAHNDHVGLTGAPPVDHDSVRAHNRVVRPMGADSPDREPTAEEWARIRAILDSLRTRFAARPDSIRNGADDDGTGTVSLLELARVFSAQGAKPRRSLLFVSHTGEEYGLLGSAWYAEHPTVPRDSIVAEIDQDMVGRGGLEDLPEGGPAYLEVIGAWRLSTQFGDMLTAANAKLPEPFAFNLTYDQPGHPLQYYCRADHYSYARWGIPSVALSRGEHLDYHQVTDEPQYIDYDALARVTSLVYLFAAEVANADMRPALNGPRPDPSAPCRQ